MNLRILLAPALIAGAFVAAACGDVNADLEPMTSSSVDFADASAMVLSHNLTSPCPVAAPVPRYLIDGGVVPDMETVDPNVQVPDVCSSTSTCEFGGSADRHCNRSFTCRSGEWAESPSITCYASACPAAGTLIADIAGRPCTLDAPGTGPDSEAMCNVGDGVCACTTGSGANVHERKWVCSAPLIRSCPLARPLIGSRCNGTAYCDYGACSAKRGIAMACQDDRWQVVPPSCSN